MHISSTPAPLALDTTLGRVQDMIVTGMAKMAHRIGTECAGNRVRQASRILMREYDDRLRPLGIQMSQLSVLVGATMFGKGGAPMGKLANALVMDQTTLSRNVVPLERAGLLRVARSAADARSKLVLLTHAGGRTIEAAYPRWEAAQRHLRRTLGPARFKALHEELAAVVALSLVPDG